MKAIYSILLFSFCFGISFSQTIHEATRSGDVNKVYQSLIDGGDINAQDNIGRTPIMIAALIGNYKVVSYFIENKCDINAKDFEGRTALDYSIRMKNIKITELLQKNNATIGSGIHDNKNNYKQPIKSGANIKQANSTKTNTRISARQTPVKAKIMKKEGEPIFFGGNAALHKYLKTQLIYPEEAKGDSISGSVHVKFEVTPAGLVTGVEITRSDNEVFNKEALRIVTEMPTWDVKDVDKTRTKNFEFRVPLHFKP